MIYQFTDINVKNLRAFLARVDMKGSEAIAMVSIQHSLNNPVTMTQLQKIVKEPKVVKPDPGKTPEPKTGEQTKPEDAPKPENKPTVKRIQTAGWVGGCTSA